MFFSQPVARDLEKVCVRAVPQGYQPVEKIYTAVSFKALGTGFCGISRTMVGQVIAESLFWRTSLGVYVVTGLMRWSKIQGLFQAPRTENENPLVAGHVRFAF